MHNSEYLEASVNQAALMLILGCCVSALTLSDLRWVWRTKNKWRHPEELTDSILESLYLNELVIQRCGVCAIYIVTLRRRHYSNSFCDYFPFM